MIEEEIAKRFAELLEKRNLTTYKYTKNCSVSKNSAYNVSQGKNVSNYFEIYKAGGQCVFQEKE